MRWRYCSYTDASVCCHLEAKKSNILRSDILKHLKLIKQHNEIIGPKCILNHCFSLENAEYCNAASLASLIKKWDAIFQQSATCSVFFPPGRDTVLLVTQPRAQKHPLKFQYCDTRLSISWSSSLLIPSQHQNFLQPGLFKYFSSLGVCRRTGMQLLKKQ